MKKHTWKIIFLVLLLAGAILLTRQIVKANTSTDGNGNDNTDIDTSSKLLGSAATAAFAKDQKLYANASALRVRETAGLTGEILKSVDVGTFIGTTTGNESIVDDRTWVEVKLSDNTLAYVDKNYTYILP